MARRRGEQPPVIAASAAHIRFDEEDAMDLSGRAKQVGSAAKWQKDIVGWFDVNGETWFGSTWVANSVSQIEWVPAWGARREPARDPKGNARSEVDSGVLKEMDSLLDRLAGVSGRQGDWAGTTGLLFTLIGDVYLLGYNVDDDDDPVEEDAVDDAGLLRAVREVWEAASPTQLERKRGMEGVEVWFKRRRGDAKGIRLPKDTTYVHLWRRHPVYPDEATAPLQPLVGVIELLDLKTKEMKGSALSRTHASLVGFDARAVRRLLPMALGGEQPTENLLLNELIAGLTTPKSDPESAAWVVPTMIAFDLAENQTVDGAWGKLDLSRTEDRAEIREDIDHLIRRLSLGLDVPPEVLTGLGDLTHWNAWQISEEAYTQHVQPLVNAIADGLTTGYLWPGLKAAGFAREQYTQARIYPDPWKLLGHPNQSKDADEAFDRGSISWAAHRRAKRFNETDAPTPEELQQRADLGLLKGQSRPTVDASNTERQPPPEPSQSRVIRSSSRPSVADLGRVGAQIEAAHMRDALMLADRAVNEALRRAGAKLRARAEKHPHLRGAVKGVDARMVGKHLGRRVVFQLAEESGDGGLDSLFAESTAEMEQAYASITTAAQRKWRRQMEAALGEDLDDEEVARMEADGERSRGVLVAGVLAVAAARLLDPSAYAPGDGEKPAGVNVPSSVARRASAAAGGVPVQGSADRMDRWEGGLASGPTTRDVAGAHGMSEEGFEWVYGDAFRDRPYEPHVELDGLTFASLDDPELEGAPWGSYAPGDHVGCLCVAAVSWSISDAAEEAA